MSRQTNIVFILTEQERYFPQWPTEYELPASSWEVKPLGYLTD